MTAVGIGREGMRHTHTRTEMKTQIALVPPLIKLIMM